VVRVRLLYIAASLLVMSQVPALAAESSAGPDVSFDKQRFDTEVTKRKDLPNFHEVHPFLYRGGAPDEKGMAELKEMGVSTIIDLRNPGEKKFDEKAQAKQLGMKYVAMPMSSKAPTKKQIDTFMDSVKNAEAHPQDGKVFVHCAHGSDRTGCLVGIWRVKQDKWNYDEAYKEMRKYWFYPKFVNLAGAVRDAAR
jgi:tyrosine-protein phosphatase SIW14